MSRLRSLKSQPRTGHTREPDPTHKLKHTIIRKTATHERNHNTYTHLTFTRTRTPLPPHSLSHPHARAHPPGEPSPAPSPPASPPAPPPADSPAAAPAAPAPDLVKLEAGEARELRLAVSVPRHLPHCDDAHAPSVGRDNTCSKAYIPACLISKALFLLACSVLSRSTGRRVGGRIEDQQTVPGRPAHRYEAIPTSRTYNSL